MVREFKEIVLFSIMANATKDGQVIKNHPLEVLENQVLELELF